jgi:DNA polymerase III subunit delta
MKLPNARIETFSKKPDSGVKAVLLYGPDAGLVATRSRDMLAAVVDDLSDPFRTVQFTFKDIADDPARLADEINSMSLLGGRRFIRVMDAPAAMPGAVGEAIISGKTDTLVVIEAGELAPTSTLRQFFEKEPAVVALPCYKDDIGTVRRVAEQALRAGGYACDGDAMIYLANSFAGDRLVVASEVEKLMTYMGDNKKITLADVRQCIGDNVESSLDDLCLAVASRDLVKIEKNLNRILSEGMGAIAPIRSIMRYFFRLQQVRSAMENGTNEQQAIATLRPPIFFKQVDIFKGHLRIWNNKAIDNMLDALLGLEVECKKTGSPAELLLSRFLCVVIARKQA